MRLQHPKVHLDDRHRKNWCGFYYNADGKRIRVTLGAKSVMNKAAAQMKLDGIVLDVNRQRAEKNITTASTVAHYVEGSYLKHGARKWKASTASTTVQRIRQHIVRGELADLKMSELNRGNLQAFLDARGGRSYSLVNHLRWDLIAICDLAVSDGVIQRNQAKEIYTPRTVRLPLQPVMTETDVLRALGVLDLRERLFCRLAIFAGMRPGEIIALRWPDIQNRMAIIDDRFYKGRNDSTKNRKPRKAALSSSVQSDLELWRHFAIGPEAFLFASEAGTPMKYENIWQRHIKPRFAGIGLAWADFRCMRRTNATLMKKAKADPKVSADNRGHGLGVAMEEYTHSTDDQKHEAVKKLEGLVN